MGKKSCDGCEFENTLAAKDCSGCNREHGFVPMVELTDKYKPKVCVKCHEWKAERPELPELPGKLKIKDETGWTSAKHPVVNTINRLIDCVSYLLERKT